MPFSKISDTRLHGNFGVRIRNHCSAAACVLTCLGPISDAIAQQTSPVEESAPTSVGDVEKNQAPAIVGSPPAAAENDAKEEPWRTDRFYLETSLFTHHFNYDPAHVNKQKLILGEWNITENWLVGASFFDNSFGQPSQYVYGGYRFRPIESQQPLYIKVSAGLVHGYTGQYQDKIPFNHSGIAPAFVPSVGYCISRLCSELVIFGGAGFLVTLGVTIP